MIAKKSKCAKQDVARFKVVTPEKISHTENIPNRIYVYGLPEQLTNEELKKEMSLFGTVTEIKMPVNKETSKFAGYAFVQFDSNESALKAIAIKNITILGNIASILPCKPYRKKSKRRRFSH